VSATLAAIARLYAERGLHVFPCRPGQKTPATKHGFHDATDDLGQVAAWWQQMPAANIGLACGPSNLAVVDCDGLAGILAWARLRARHPDTATPATVATPSGGQHWLYRADPDRPVGNSASKLAPAVDTRGLGGYIVAAGSAVNGRRYRVMHVPDGPAPTVPEWVWQALAPKPILARPLSVRLTAGRTSAYATAALQNEVQTVLDCGPKTRHDTVHRSAVKLGSLVGAGLLDEHLARTALIDAGEARGHDGSYTARQCHRDVSDGLAYGIVHPRQLQAAS